MVFSCRELLFSKLFSCERPQATEILEKIVFLGFQTGPADAKGSYPQAAAGSRQQQAAAETTRHSSSKHNGSSAAASSTKNCVFLGWH